MDEGRGEILRAAGMGFVSAFRKEDDGVGNGQVVVDVVEMGVDVDVGEVEDVSFSILLVFVNPSGVVMHGFEKLGRETHWHQR